MELNKFSDQDLEAIANEDYAAMSEQALLWLANQEEASQSPDYATGLTREALQGASLGWADEAGLGLAALAGSFSTGESVSDVYGKMRDRYDTEQASFREENPVASTVAEIGGGFTTGGLGAAKLGATTLPKLAVTGATGGGIYGAGTDHEDRLRGAKQGALIGGITSPVMGFAGNKMADRLGKSKLMSSIQETAPTKDAIKEASEALYEKARESGVKFRADRYQTMLSQMASALKSGGFHQKIHPKVAAAISELAKETGDIDIKQLDILRRILGSAAKSIEPDEKRLASNLIDIMDNRLDKLNPADVVAGNPKNVGKTLKEARSLWSKKRRLDMIETAFEKAKNQASGIENGIRIQFRQILNNPKKVRGFSKDEIDLMRKVVRGGPLENALKLAGKLGFSENQATQLIGTTIGIAGGAAVGGPFGAVAVPLVGQAAKNAAQKMTRNNAANVATAVARGATPDALYRQMLANPQTARQILSGADPAAIDRAMKLAQGMNNRQWPGLLGGGLGVSLSGQF